MSETETTYQDPFPDELRDQLIADFHELRENDDAWTWLDGDPSVAWDADPEESYHASLRALLERAGWEPCYHRDGARLHFNVKVDGPQAYRGQRDTIDSADLHPDAENRVGNIVVSLHDMEMEMFWMDELPGFVRYELGVTEAKPYSCGRQGGYVNISKMETDGENMIRLAQFLTRAKDGYNSFQYGEDLALRAIEEDQETQLMELASSRIERIEA